MGNCFSDPSKSKPPTGGQRLGSGPSSTNTSPQTSTNHTTPNDNTASSRNAKGGAPPRTLGEGAMNGADGSSGADMGTERERALKAAEERAKAAKVKGVHNANPKAGQLSAKLAAERKTATSPRQDNERMMDQGQWN